MSMKPIVLLSAVVLLVAYRTYGRLLARLLRLDPNRATPAVELRDDVDYVPIEPKFLLGQHFSAIAAAGPIVGPILAGVLFGWVPAIAWILLGSIFIGGVHDMTSLVASIRHGARSIAEVVQLYLTRRSYLLFLAFIWIALVYIIVAFTDLTAGAFVGVQTLDDGTQVLGAGIATSSILYLILPIIMGLLLRYTKLSLVAATCIFVPLIGVVIWAGQLIPFDLAALLGIPDASAHKVWDVILLVYCFVAAVVPMWLLLQPRGHLGGFFLYLALGGGMLGLLFGDERVSYPAFTGWTAANGQNLFPMMFILIACGACSGFHSLISSGTTSKQLRTETDAKPIGYGAMLIEALVAVMALCCVMMLLGDDPRAKGQPNQIYALGLGEFLRNIGINPAFGVPFAMMAFTTFVYDTLDVCTRLGRYVLEELLGRHDRLGRWLATGLTAAAPLTFVMRQVTDAAGNPQPVWKTFWSLFGASNQLLAAMALLGVTVWLWRTRRAQWVWPVCGLPTLFMFVMSVWALLSLVGASFAAGNLGDPVLWVSLVLVGLAVLLLIEAINILARDLRRPSAPGEETADGP